MVRRRMIEQDSFDNGDDTMLIVMEVLVVMVMMMRAFKLKLIKKKIAYNM